MLTILGFHLKISELSSRLFRMYAIVDIETTGAYASGHAITEIAILLHDGQQITGQFQSLVNPHQQIPRYITALTGITNEMVEDAPSFEDIAEQVYQLLEGRVFIAHSVNFDFPFVKGHLGRCGYDLQVKKLCTVRLSRKLVPGFPSYSLGNLCHSLGIPLEDRHRAAGDAAATARLFSYLLQRDEEKFILKSLQRNSKETILPPNVPKEQFDQLPYTPGVYYFHDEKGKVIYVGKARNIRHRVNSHFSNNSQSRQKQNFIRHTHQISYQPCATELMAQILESTEIKKRWPVYNYSQKRQEQLYGIFAYEDRNGYLRLIIEKNKARLEAIHTFHYLTEGHSLLRRLIQEYRLCPKLCFIQTSNDRCVGMEDGYCDGACEHEEAADSYNERVQAAMRSMLDRPSFAIIEEGLQAAEQSCVLVWKGEFVAMGYIASDIQISDPDQLRDYLTPYKENLFIRNLVHSYASKFPGKVKYF